MATYTIILTEAEDKALSHAALSQDNWIQNAVHERCRVAIEEIVSLTVQKCLDTNTAIPDSKDAMVTLAFTKGWVKTAAQRVAEAEAQAELDAQNG